MLATSFRTRRPTIVDRIAYLGILASFALAFTPSRLQMIGFLGIVGSTVLIWALRRRSG